MTTHRYHAMTFVDFLYGAPVWQMGTVICALIVGGTILALVIVDRLWSRELRRSHNDIAGFLIAVVGVIFAILVSSLAITVLTRQDRAEALVVQEAETLAAINRETLLMTPQVQLAFRDHVHRYLDAVIDREWPEMSRAEWPDAADAPLLDLWADITHLPVDTNAGLLTAQELRARFDKLAEIRRGRGELATTGVDRVVWDVVLMGCVATILFAVLFGVQNFLAHLLMTSLLAFTVALAIIMIVAIDWPYFGDDIIHPERLVTLRAAINPEGKGPL